MHRWCRTCGIEVDNLSDHQSIHSLEKAHKCIFCQKTFSRRRNLVEHLQTHLGKKRTSKSMISKVYDKLDHFSDFIDLGVTSHSLIDQ